ncbi:MAG: rRNA maturation RNase YbeY [Clostridiales bacterium]|nr:rRNA maturation RNase YbeY [Clostridiales bacterium]
MTLTVDNIENEESAEFCRIFQQVADFGVKEILQTDKFEITVFLTDGDFIREINKEHRGIDKETDVLSFPLWNRLQGEEPFINPENDNIMLGDIIISLPRLKEQAEEYAHSEKREAAYLCIHGVLHLLGYDHMEAEEKTQMRLMEETLLAKLNITRED